MQIKDWLPILEKLIWPVFITILLIVFRSEIKGLYAMATEGRSLKIGGWIEIGEKVRTTEVKDFASRDLSIQAFEGDENAIVKGDEPMLRELQNKLNSSEIKSIDVLKITDGKEYYKTLLLKYVGTLGIKQIVFINQGKFDGWISSSAFSGQLITGSQSIFHYQDLKQLVGIKSAKIAPTEKTSEALKKMMADHTDGLAVVEGDTFKSFINRQDILTSIVSNAILHPSE